MEGETCDFPQGWLRGGGFSVWGFPQPLPSARCSLLRNLRSIVVKLSLI